MMHCWACGADFEHPDIYREKENIDGECGVWLHSVASCPYCGEEFFEEMKEDEDDG